MARKNKKSRKVDPNYLLKQKDMLKRNCRKTVFFNKAEIAAINEYKNIAKVSSLSALIRQAVMERVLNALEEQHPTLF